MMSKTIEELQKELHSARSRLSYHKNKNKNKPKRRSEGESPKAKANRLAANIAWNDDKRAMAHVIALLTANDEDYAEARDQAYLMPVKDVRELIKGHEADVGKHVKVLQEKRRGKRVAKDAKEERRKAKSEAKKPQQLSLALKQAGLEPSYQPEKNFDDAVTKMLDEAWPDTAAPVKKTVPKSQNRSCGDSADRYIYVPVKPTTLRLAKEVVSTLTGFEGLSDEQVVGHILSRYLQNNA